MVMKVVQEPLPPFNLSLYRCVTWVNLTRPLVFVAHLSQGLAQAS
jgi:hypothetical protein